MKFEVSFTPSADEDLACYRTYQQKIIARGISRFLEVDAHVETRRRKQLRPESLAPWELRLGHYRLFYEIRGSSVRILAIGHKEHNDLFIRGEKVEL
jgi:mRNA-degrading endonuclease RelE of RelBE toxin-antitoxin system